MAPTNYSKAGLPQTIFGISCQSHRAWKISHVLSYYKVDIRKGASKVELLNALQSFALTVSGREEEAIKTWLQAQNVTLAGLASAITTAKGAANLKDDVADGDETAKPPSGKTTQDPDGKECPVCVETLTAGSFPDCKTTASCAHEPTFCRDCLERCVNDRIRDHPWATVHCPECNGVASSDDVERLASEKAFERYRRNEAIANIRHLPNFVMCLAPNCGSGQVHNIGTDQPTMTCIACGFKTCITHMLPHHEGQTCAEYDATRQEQLEQEAESEKYLAENTKVCPGPGCGIHTIKAGRACNHITCKQCLFDYCWLCLVPYDMVRHIGGTAHARDCEQWTDETPAQYKARRAVERRENKARRAENPLKRKRTETEDDLEDEEV